VNIEYLNKRLNKVAEKIEPPKTRQITIIRKIYEPGRDADGNSKPRKCSPDIVRVVNVPV
jgi:hypothetical protein